MSFLIKVVYQNLLKLFMKTLNCTLSGRKICSAMMFILAFY